MTLPLTPQGGTERKENSQWLFLAIGSAGALGIKKLKARLPAG